MARKKPKKQLPPKRPRTKPHRYTSEQVIDALKKTNGLQYLAARMLKMCQTSMSDYCKRPEVKEVLVQLRGENVDHAEKQLQRELRFQGNERAEGRKIFKRRAFSKHYPAPNLSGS